MSIYPNNTITLFQDPLASLHSFYQSSPYHLHDMKVSYTHPRRNDSGGQHRSRGTDSGEDDEPADCTRDELGRRDKPKVVDDKGADRALEELEEGDGDCVDN